MGNQQSLVNSLNYLGAYVYISNDQKELNKSDILILPESELSQKVFII